MSNCGMQSLSVHADTDDLVEWLGRVDGPPETVFTVHGEEHAADALCGRIERELELVAVRPRQGERVSLF